MASDPSKTERATPRRRQKAREEGQLLQSNEIGHAFALMGGVLIFLFMGDWILELFISLVKDRIMALSAHDISAYGSPKIMRFYLKIMGPFFFGLAILAVASKLIQHGWIFTTKPLQPKVDKLNVVTNAKQIFFSVKNWTELIKNPV